MLTLAAYVDDSFEREPFFQYALGGYLGRVEMWDTLFSSAWRAVLDSAPQKVAEFKTADCRHRVGEFADSRGWTDAKRLELTKRLVSVIADTVPHKELIGYASVFVPEMNVPLRDEKNGMRDLAFSNCMRTMIGHLAKVATAILSPGDKIQIVMDEMPDLVSLARKNFTEVRGLFPPQVQDVFPFPVFRKSHEAEPLQAADMFAYETFKEVKSRLEIPERPVSRALERLLASHMNVAECSTFMQCFLGSRLKDAGIVQETNITRPHVLFASGSPWRDDGQFPYCLPEIYGPRRPPEDPGSRPTPALHGPH